MIYSFGSNGSGQLGLGHRDDVSSPQPVPLPDDIPLDAATTIVAGGNHTLILSSGRLWIAGSLPAGLDSNKNKAFVCSSPLFVPLPTPQHKPVKLCAATWESVTIATDDNQLYSLGVGTKGQLGLGEAVSSSLQFEPVGGIPSEGVSIIDLSGSMGHIAVLLSNGDVYSWGSARKGQMGEPSGNVWAPRKVNGVLPGVESLRCGKDHTALYAPHQPTPIAVLGADRSGSQTKHPLEVSPGSALFSGWSCSYLLSPDGQVTSWGRDHHGQLAPANLPAVQKFASGSEHALAQLAGGDVVSWGWGEHGNCSLPVDGAGNVRGRWNTLHVEGEVLALGAGCATSWIITRQRPILP